jgi:hypothetical protein
MNAGPVEGVTGMRPHSRPRARGPDPWPGDQARVQGIGSDMETV